MRDTSHECVWHGPFNRVTWLIYMSSPLSVSTLKRLLRSCICATWLIYTCDSHICVPWCIHMCGTSHSCVWHGSFNRVTWLIYMSSPLSVSPLMILLRSFVCVTWLIYICDSYICVPWLIHMCGTSHSCVWHGSFKRVTWLIYMSSPLSMSPLMILLRSFICVTWLIHMCESYFVCHDSSICETRVMTHVG